MTFSYSAPHTIQPPWMQPTAPTKPTKYSTIYYNIEMQCPVEVMASAFPSKGHTQLSHTLTKKIEENKSFNLNSPYYIFQISDSY